MAPVNTFTNEPPADFSRPENEAGMRAAIARVRLELGREYDLVIGGQRSKTQGKIRSMNPAKSSELVGLHQKAGAEHIDPAMRAAWQAFDSWKFVPAKDRADWLFRVAAVLRKRKFEFNAWLTLEVGKNWAEAEADTCEAIDFCELYARLALQMDEAETVVQLPG